MQHGVIFSGKGTGWGRGKGWGDVMTKYYISNSHSQVVSLPRAPVIRWELGAIFLYEATIETMGVAIAGVVAHIFRSFISAPLLGISVGLFTAKLVVKIIDHYNVDLSIRISKRVNHLVTDRSHLQMISLLFVSASGFLSRSCGFILGIGLGAFNAIVLDIENCKLLQRANRHKLRYED